MIRKNEEFKPDLRENMRGGDGTVEVTNLVSDKDLNDKGRLFGTIVLKPGCGIGYHIHENDTELFYVLEGKATYSDNGEIKEIAKGDLAICPAGTGHSVKNDSDENVVLMALIVYA